MGFTLKSVNSHMIEVLADLHAACFSVPWDGPAFAKLLAMPGAEGLIAMSSGRPIGFVLVQGLGGDAEILTLGVVSAEQRAGAAKALLRGAVEGLKDRGIGRLLLDVAQDNEAALGLYKGLGFTPVGMRPAYYRRSGKAAMDALTLCLDLNKP